MAICRSRMGVWAVLVAGMLALPCPVWAQPSGGPYGPVQQAYEVPADAANVFYVAPDGSADAEGTAVDEPTTLRAAIERAATGDAIILRGGTYRTGDLRFNQGITLQPYRDERPILNGTKVASDWQQLRDGLWRVRWETVFPMGPEDWWRREREAARTPLHRFNGDMVFVDGQPLKSAGWPGELDEDSFYVDYDAGYVYIGIDPAGKEVEITAYDVALLRTTGEVHGKQTDKKGPTVRGITFTQYAFRAIEIEGHNPEGVSPESAHGKDAVGSTFENCTFTHCARVAGYFRGDGLTIRHCLVSDTGTEGIYVLSSNDVLLERNIITRNNATNITGYYASAVKIFNQCYRVTCRENLVVDNPNESSGIWYDVGNRDGVFVNNWIERTDNGFFFEISTGAICAGNVFVDCPTGIKILNARGVRMYQNTLVSSMVSIERTTRSAVGDHFGWHPATGPDVDEREAHVFVGNLLVGGDEYRRPLLWTGQVRELRERLTEPQVDELDYNVYVRRVPVAGRVERGTWTGAPWLDVQTPDELRSRDPRFDAGSQTYDDYFGPLFRGERLSRYEPLSEFPGAESAAPLPAEVLELLGWAGNPPSFPGAFPVR